MLENCIFCKISSGQVSSEKLIDGKNFFVIKDINPSAKTHLLIISKNHIENLKEFKNDSEMSLEVFQTIKSLSEKIEEPKEFKISCNNGKSAGQEVMHLHIHFISNSALNF